MEVYSVVSSYPKYKLSTTDDTLTLMETTIGQELQAKVDSGYQFDLSGMVNGLGVVNKTSEVPHV
jgi:hypothetical protein